MDPITLAKSSLEFTQLVKRLSRTNDELEPRIELMDAVLQQALTIFRILKSLLPDGMYDLCAPLEKKGTMMLRELQGWEGRFKGEGKNKKFARFNGSYAKLEAQSRFPELREDINEIVLHVHMLLLNVHMEAMTSLASSSEDANKKLDSIFEIVSRLPTDPGPPREPGKYVTIDDGLNPIFELPPSLCATPERLQRTLAIVFEKKPGLAQIERGHFVVYHWSKNRLICLKEWPAVIEGGCGIRIAFVMGNWLGFKRNKCIRCLKPMKASTGIMKGQLRNCKSCNLQFSHFEPLDFDYEPDDIGSDFGGYHKYKQESHRKPSISPSPTLATNDTPGKAQPPKDSTTSTETLSIDLVCRRFVVKWEPIFNIAFRYLFCRCIVWRSTPSQLVPEMTFCLAVSCPRHNNESLSFPDYGDSDYDNDPYFDKFGGYGLFRLLVLRIFPPLYDQLGRQAFLSNFDETIFAEKLNNISKEKLAAIHPELSEYHFEHFDVLEKAGTSFPSNVTQWLAQQRLERKKEASAHTWSGLGIDPRDEVSEELKEWPARKQVGEILRGEWSGKPHWVIED